MPTFLKAIRRPSGETVEVDHIPPEWVGPFHVSSDDYNSDLGNGWDGILIPVDLEELRPGGWVLGVGFIVDEDWEGVSTCFPEIGTLTGDDFGSAQAMPLDVASYNGQIITTWFGTPVWPFERAFPIGPNISQFWIDSFEVPPTSGSARLWLRITKPVRV